MFLELIDDTTNNVIKEIVIEYNDLNETVKELLNLSQVTVKNMQQMLEGPLDAYVEKTLENTTQMHEKGNRVSGALHPRGHVKKRLPRLSTYHIKGTVCTDTVFYSGSCSINGHTGFQLFLSKLSKFLYTVPLKSKSGNVEALKEFIAQIDAPERFHFGNAKSQVSKAWKKIMHRWGMKRYAVEPCCQNQNGVKYMVQVVKNRTAFLIELHNALEEN